MDTSYNLTFCQCHFKVQFQPTVFPLMPCGSQSGDMVTLGCLAIGFNPPAVTFSWTKSSFLWSTSLTDTIHYPAVQKGNVYTGVSQVRVRRQDWDARQTFQCAVTHAAGNGQASFQKPCKLLAFKQNPTLKVISSPDEHGTYTASCFAKEFAPKTHAIRWLKNGTDITRKIDLISTVSESRKADGKKVYNAASFLTVNSNDVNEDTEFTCVFTGGQRGKPQRPSVFMLPPLEQTNKAEVTLTCFVKDFFPKEVFVSWLVDDEEANSTYAFNTTEPIENNGFYSAYGQLFVSLDQWQRDGAVYSCVVYHESVVNTTRAIVRSIGYRTFDKNRIDLNMNINQDSKYLFVMDSLELHHPGLSGDDNIASVAIVFILLFLITLLLIFGTTVRKRRAATQAKEKKKYITL
uniref:Ig-like domain-containing protein n=1 Tax=Oreochromis niloticus TaxID=8128 RepID=A0A669DZD0_ORENI